MSAIVSNCYICSIAYNVRRERPNPLVFIILLAFSFSSCISYEQSLLLQESDEGSYEYNLPIYNYKVRSNDILNISVVTLDESNTEILNPPTQAGAQVNQQGTGNPQLLFNGYSLDESGSIDLPLIGRVKVLGMSLDEIGDTLEEKLRPYKKFNSIRVNLSNFRVTVMGEVITSGVQYVYEREYTVLQAISNAGGLGDLANRERVKLLRADGKKMKTIWLDLTKPEIVSSAYYHLLPGDLIYVEPLKAKVSRANTQNVSIGVSIISLAVTLITLFSR